MTYIPFIRRSLVAISLLLAMLLVPTALPTAARAAESPPNIVFIMIDDMGWMDLHCQGNKALHTPQIDRLAEQGMRFTDAYAAAPVCSPTRAAVMTGQWPARMRITNHIPDQKRFAKQDAPFVSAPMFNFLSDDYETIAERLKSAGYATAFIGKWHLCGGRRKEGLGDVQYYPERQGFDVNIGGCAYGGPPTYFDPYRIHNIKPRKEGEYLTDRLIDESIAFIRKNRERPFFLNLWNYTVHWPMEAKQAMLEKYAGREGPGIRDTRYAAMIECLDEAIGRLMAALDEMKLTDNTLVIFTSDNGGFSGVADNRPLRRGKGYLYEGGIRVPLIVRWPGVVKPGSLCRTPVMSTDFYPTLLDAAGLNPTKSHRLDGASLRPLLDQTAGFPKRPLYWHYPNYAFHGANRLGSAIREGNWKLIERFDDGSVELHNLADDLSEKTNLANKLPERAAAMKAKLQAWRKETKASMPTRAKR